MADSDTVPLHPRSSQSDIDEIENLINASVQPVTSAVQVSSSAIVPVPGFNSVSSSSTYTQKMSSSSATVIPSVPSGSNGGSGNRSGGIASDGFCLVLNTLTEPVWETIKRDVFRISNNLKLGGFPNPYGEGPGKVFQTPTVRVLERF